MTDHQLVHTGRTKITSRAANAAPIAAPGVRLAIVGCGKAKKTEAAPARDLYTGGLFRAALSHALGTADGVRIVSARYGLLALDRVVEPYDLRLEELDAEERAAWGERVAVDLARSFANRAVTVTLYMGKAYADTLAPALDRAGLRWERPLRGVPIGQQLQWFGTEHARPIASAPPLPRRPLRPRTSPPNATVAHGRPKVRAVRSRGHGPGAAPPNSSISASRPVDGGHPCTYLGNYTPGKPITFPPR